MSITFDPDLETEAKLLSEQTGESVLDAVRVAVRERLERVTPKVDAPKFKSADEVMAFVRSFNLQRINEDLTDDEILGYGPDGIPE
jgi:hypothetical protein